jgi:hypothetical protein
MRFADGWIKLYRAVEDHWITDNPEYFRAWVLLLLKANFGKRSRMFNGRLIDVKPGQLIGSVDYFAKLMKLSTSKARTLLTLLEEDRMITVEATKRGTKLSINNYETYQDSQQTEHIQIANRSQTGHKPVANRSQTDRNTIRKERKEENVYLFNTDNEAEVEPDGKRSRKAVFVKPELTEVMAYADSRTWKAAEAQAFYDYQEASGWKVGNKPMKNWQAAMRTWESKLPPRPKAVCDYFLSVMSGIEGDIAAYAEFERFFGHYEKQGWRTGSGQRVTNFEPLVDQWIAKNRSKS